MSKEVVVRQKESHSIGLGVGGDGGIMLLKEVNVKAQLAGYSK